jgi:hypothetical protein
VAVGLFLFSAGVWLGSIGIGLRAGNLTVDEILWTIAFAAFPVVGLILAIRRPSNPLGWCWLLSVPLIGVGVTLNVVGEQLALGDDSVRGAWYAVVSAVISPPGIALLAIPTLYLFPNGRLPARYWRPAVWAGILATAAFSVGDALSPTIEFPSGSVDNPIGLDSLVWLDSVVQGAGGLLFLVIALGVVSLVVRYRRSTGEERLQLKWVTLIVSAVLFAVVFLLVLEPMGVGQEGLNLAGSIVQLAVGWGFPAAVAVAILKYRLYSIERLISRTVTYGLVAVVLAAVYLIAVVALGSQLGRDNSLSVAASTLATAAVFTPVRRRVQELVERRFDRARYDALLVVDDFSTRLRDEVDLENLVSDLADVVDRTMRPANVSLWLAG